MLEHYVEDRIGTGATRVPWGLVASAIAHVGVVGVLVVAAMWQIDKVSYERGDTPLQIGGAASSPPPPAGTSAPDRPEADQVRIVRDAQQTRRTRTDASEASGDLRAGVPHGDPNGEIGGTGTEPGGDGTGPGRLVGDVGCGEGRILCSDSTPPPPRPDPPRIVPSSLIDGKRYRGTTQIKPPDKVRDEMSRSGKRSTRAAIKLCLSGSGRVSSVKLLTSSGYPTYDRKLVAAVRAWRYHPFKLDTGQAIPVCTSVVFKYAMR